MSQHIVNRIADHFVGNNDASQEEGRKFVAKELAPILSALAKSAGYLNSVRSDRRCKDQFGDVFAGQTFDWAEGAKELAAEVTAIFEAWDCSNE